MEFPDTLDTSHLVDVEHLAVTLVPLSSLIAADSPRRSGESREHVRRLAESENGLPPIVVHRPTMRVVDGMHRLRVAESRGQEKIEVKYFDGDEACCFVLAVRANIMHGLPLTLADRKAAATRIMNSYPQWSDRMIASASGLAAKTVAAARLTDKKPQLDSRVGRDGRTRPLNGAARREIAARLISENPSASLRVVARGAGISAETVRSVRARLRPDRGPVSPPHSNTGEPRPPQRRSGIRAAGPDRASAVPSLWADPALRSNECARDLMRMLASPLRLKEGGDHFIENIPVHRLSGIADAARACAQGWQDFAERVEKQWRAGSGAVG
jgi:hypothetical protein